MAYSDPRTWVTGELVTAALMNAQLRDNLDAVIEGTTGAYVNAVVGPHAIGGSTVDYVRLGLTGAFTSGGASTVAFGLYTSGVLTGHSGDSAAIAGIKANNSIVTAGNCTTIAQLWVSEPQITVGAGAVTNAATVYIEGAANEATNDYALWVDDGATKLDSTLAVGGKATLSDELEVTGHTFLSGTVSIGYLNSGLNKVLIGGPYTSPGTSTYAQVVGMSNALTAVTGDTAWAVGINIGPSITTQDSETIADVASVVIDEPDITKGASGAAVTRASTLWIRNAPTEGVKNYALYVAGGESQFNGQVNAERYYTAVSTAISTDGTTNLYASAGASGSGGGMIAMRDGYGRFGLFWYGSYDTLTKLAGNSVYSATKDNASTINIYYESGNIVYQNKTAIASLSVHYTRILD